MKEKVLSILLCFAMVISMVPTTALAAGEENPKDVATTETAPEGSASESVESAALQALYALVVDLPDAVDITDETLESVGTQMDKITAAYGALNEEEQAAFDESEACAKVYSVSVALSGETPSTYGTNEASVDGTAYATFAAAWNAAVGKGTATVKLLANVTATAGSFGSGNGFSNGALEVPDDKIIILDLNGYTLNRGLTTAQKDGYVIYVSFGGTLTVQDNSDSGSGKITGGNNTSYGGGIYNGSNGKLTITGGSITGNTAGGGGGGISNVGTLTISGGSITNNTATTVDIEGDGGGIRNVGTLTISGGSITNNTAALKGGGIYNYSGTVNLSGAPTITGNNAGSNANNLYLEDTKVNITGALTNKTPIGITMASPGVFTAGTAVINSTYRSKFTSDNASYGVATSNSQLTLAQFYTLTKKAIGGSVSLTVASNAVSSACAGDTVKVTATTPNTGYKNPSTVTAVKTNSTTTVEVTNNTFTMPDYGVTVTATYTPITFTVKYDANGGTGSMENSTYTYDNTSFLKINTFKKTGYLFRGWAKTKENAAAGKVDVEANDSVRNLTTTDGATITLYAVWKDNRTAVTPPTIAAKTYNGSKQTATVANSTLYTVTTNSGGTNKGSYNVELTLTDMETTKWASGDDDGDGKITLTFTINPLDISTGATVGAFGLTYNGSAQTPTATVSKNSLVATGSWSSVTNVADKTTFTATGNYTGEITGQATGMTPRTLADKMVSAPNNATYNGSAHTPTVTVKDGTWLQASDYSITYSDNIKAGTATVTVTAQGNYTGKVTKNFTISYLATPTTPYSLGGTKGTNDWYTSNVTLIPTNGYIVSTSLGGKYTNSITLTESTTEDYKIYLKNSVGQMTDAITVGAIKIDKVAPTGTISIGTNNWKTFINTITFGLFFNEKQTVSIATDTDVSGIAKIEYAFDSKDLTLNEVKQLNTWTQGSSIDVTLTDAKKFVYFARITDNAGNVTYLSTNGAVYDTSNPTISGITNNATYYTTQKALISDTNLDQITLDDTKVTSPVTLEGNKSDTYVITATDKAGNKTTYTVTMKEIASLTSTIDAITEDNVKSSDLDAINAVKTAVSQVDTVNATKPENEALEKITANCDALTKKIAATKSEAKRITDAINAYDLDTVKSSDKTAIETLIADLDTLAATENVTADEKEALANVKVTANKLLAKISDTAAEKVRITEAIDAYDIATVTSADKNDLDDLVADLDTLINADNLTADEKEALANVKTTANELLTKISDTATEKTRITDAINAYDLDTVKSSDKTAIDTLIADLETLTATENVTADEKEALANVKATANKLLAKISDTATEKARIIEAINAYDIATVTSADKTTLDALVGDLNTLINADNLTADEKEALANVKTTANELLKKIEDTKTELERIKTELASFNPDSVELTDKDDIQSLIDDMDALFSGKNMTEDEKKALNEEKEICKDLLTMISNAQAVIDSIAALPDAKDVTKADETSIKDVKADFDKLTDNEKRLVDLVSTQKLAKVATALANQLLKDVPTGTSVTAVGNTTFDPNIVLVVKKTAPSQKDVLSVSGVAKGKEIVSLFDISLMLDGQKVQPNGKVRVTLTLTDEQLAEYSDFKIVYIDEKGNATIMESTVNGNQITFETDHFSSYGIIGTKRIDAVAPETGDTSNLALWITLLLLSSTAGAVFSISRKRKKVNSK